MDCFSAGSGVISASRAAFRTSAIAVVMSEVALIAVMLLPYRFWLVAAALPSAVSPMMPTPAATTPATPTALRIFVLTPRSPHQEALRSAVCSSAAVEGRPAMAGLQVTGVGG